MSEFYQTNSSVKNTFARRLGESSMQWSKGVKPTSPGVYPQLVEGQTVQLDGTTGEIIAVGGADELVLGIVLVPNSDRNGQRVTVMTQGTSIIRCGSTAAINVGTYVSSVGINTTVTPNRPNVTEASTGEYAVGIALEGASGANEEIQVLVLSSSVLIP